jgi:hypothetical protein
MIEPEPTLKGGL